MYGAEAKQYNGGVNGGGMALSGAVVPQPTGNRVPMVTEQTEGMYKRTEALHAVIGQLEDRLSAVLMPLPPAAEARGEGRPSPGVALAGCLMEMNARIEHAIARVQSMLQRVEL